MNKLIKRVKHLFGRHDYFIIKNFSSDCRKIGCRLCNKTYAMNDRVKALCEWDNDFEELYKDKHFEDNN